MAEPLLVGPCHPEAVTGTTNGLLIFHRMVLLNLEPFGLDKRPLRIAARTNLGQGERGRPGPLLAEVAARRARALAAQGRTFVTVELRTQGAMVTGTGVSGVRDVGIELHGTYGWPIIPGSTLKGVTREYARQLGDDCTRRLGTPMEKIFGSLPEADPAIPGAVTFFDALPGPGGVDVAVHVLTPHTRGYRSGAEESPKPPGEHVNPEPIEFLAVEDGVFVAHLAGEEPHLSRAVELLIEAVGDLGVGAKTAAGYGYLTAERRTT